MISASTFRLGTLRFALHHHGIDYFLPLRAFTGPFRSARSRSSFSLALWPPFFSSIFLVFALFAIGVLLLRGSAQGLGLVPAHGKNLQDLQEKSDKLIHGKGNKCGSEQGGNLIPTNCPRRESVPSAEPLQLDSRRKRGSIRGKPRPEMLENH